MSKISNPNLGGYTPLEEQNIINVEINKEMRESFLSYSMAVLTSRALPDVRDGLKPVHRRILYTMYENSLYPDKPHRKCADTVGSVLGRYHPHGDASVYDAMVRLAQDFSMRYVLVDGHGNFGSVDGDPPAAYRYTESRMSKIALEMLTNIDKDTVDFTTNYDDRLKEPTVLPSRYPNLLANGSTGIAVGMATNIPPHNLGELIDGICCVIDNPEAELDDIMEHIKGPDFPTSGIIMGRAGIRAAYATGRGKITLRGRAEIVENEKNGRFQIIITELPYQVNKARLIESIADLHKDKRIEGLADINDYSSKRGGGMKIVIDLKRDANPQVVLNQLYQMTQLQISYGIIQLALVNGEPKILTLKQIIEEYIKFQCEIITRRTQYDLNKAQAREHILEGLARAIDIVDEIIATIRGCKGGQAEAKVAIMEKFDFDDPQASAIVAFRLGQLAGLEIQKIIAERDELRVKIAEYLEILGSETKVKEILKDELSAIGKKYSDDRRTEISNVLGEVDIEDLIAEEDCVFTLTKMGYIKRQPVETYQVQRRGGKGIKGMSRREAIMELKKWFQRFGIESWWNKKVEELSKGMAQKVQFITTVVHKPSLLILDEPFSGFDPVNAQVIREEILRLKDEGATIILSTHNMESVEELCDNIALFNKSHVVITGGVDEIRRKYGNNNVEIVYTAKTRLEHDPKTFKVLSDQDECGRHTAVLALEPDAEANDVLKAVMEQEIAVNSFKELVPRMNDIFIKLVTEEE